MVDVKLLLWNLANIVINHTVPRAIDMITDNIVRAKAEEYKRIEEELIKAPYRVVVENYPATLLEPYNKKKVMLGFTWCPFCQEHYQEIRNEIKKGKADVIWIDRDVLGEKLVKDLDLDEVPTDVKVIKREGKVIVKTVDGKKKVVYKDSLISEKKRKTKKHN